MQEPLIKCFKGFKLNILWTILHCSHMSLGWPSPVVFPSWSLASAKPADHTLSSINIFQTWPYTLILIRSSTVCEWRDALVQCFSTPPPPHPTSDYQIISLNTCMYVCVYIYIYIYIYTHTHTHTGAGHIIRISSKSWFISLIPFKMWNLYTFIPHRLIYFKCLFLLILMIITDN